MIQLHRMLYQNLLLKFIRWPTKAMNRANNLKKRNFINEGIPFAPLVNRILS